MVNDKDEIFGDDILQSPALYGSVNAGSLSVLNRGDAVPISPNLASVVSI